LTYCSNCDKILQLDVNNQPIMPNGGGRIMTETSQNMLSFDSSMKKIDSKVEDRLLKEETKNKRAISFINNVIRLFKKLAEINGLGTKYEILKCSPRIIISICEDDGVTYSASCFKSTDSVSLTGVIPIMEEGDEEYFFTENEIVELAVEDMTNVGIKNKGGFQIVVTQEKLVIAVTQGTLVYEFRLLPVKK